MQNDSLSSSEVSPPACLTEDKTQTADCRGHTVIDDLRAATPLDENSMDLLPQEGDAPQPAESVQSQQLMLRPPNDQTDTERQDRAGDRSPTTAESQKEKMYHSVLRQIQQQQMLKHGRRLKKKTLMKMAKLYVISKGWDSETMEVTGSNGPSPEHERLVLNQEEDTLTPLVSSEGDRVNINSLKDGKKESVLLNVSTDATFSGETLALVTLNKRPHTSIKPTKEDSGAAEMSTNLLDDSQESLLYSMPVKASKKKGKLKKITSVTLQEDTKITCDIRQLSSNSPAEISSAAAPKRQAFKTRKKTKSGVKKSTKEKLLPQTFTEYNDVTTLDVSESNEMDAHAAKQNNIKNSSLIQETVFNGMDLNAAKQEHDKSETNSPKDGKNSCDKESVLSTISTDATFSAVAATLKKRKRPHTSKMKATDESQTGFSLSTNLPDESQESLLNSRPVRASKKRKISSKTLKEDTRITRDNNEQLRNIQAEISGVDSPKKQASKQRKKTKRGVKKSTKQKLLPLTLKKRQRRNKAQWTARRRLKQRQINAYSSNPAEIFNSSPCDSVTGEEIIKLKDENERNTVQTLTANTKIKHFTKHENYDPHHHEVKSQKPLKCSFCGRSFRHIAAFTVHRRIHTGEKPYRCPTCGKRFSQISKLNMHSKTHSEPRAVCCPCCNEKFKSKDQLISHFHVHMKSIQSSNKTEDANSQQVDDCLDSPSSNKPLRCSVCFTEFLNRATLKMHRRTHGGKSYTCSICGKKFCKSSSLSIHEKTHRPVKPYSCSMCCNGFDKLQELERHSQMHSGASPFSCAKCEKAFSSFKLLRSHQVFEVCSEKQDAAYGNRCEINGFFVSQSVEGQIVTPVFFKCPICKQLHRHWCHYILHLQTHTHNKSYTCETCRQQYNEAAGIRSHCTVCCRRSGEERACRSALTDIWKEPEAPENEVFEPHLNDQSLPLDEDNKLQMSTLPQVEKVEKVFTGVSSPPASPGSVSLSVTNDFDISASSLSPGFCPQSDRASQQPIGFHLQSLIRRHCGRYSCGHCGKSFSWWTKLWLHKRHHRQTSRASFSCSQCDLEFRFWGSYMDHQREHAAQTPYACPLCPDAFVSEEKLSTHVSECHKQCDNKKCSTCGKNFSTLRNLKKHKMLHKGVNSYFRLPCNVSFSSNSALKTHLKTHKTRLSVPQPAEPAEPLLFPYHCRRCTATFSSTDLLQAHQVCHFIAGRKPESSPSESVASFIPSRATEDTQAGVSRSSQRKRRLPVSNKKHLFRYPHPDRLYVVPVISSEPPIVISDTEEERPSISTSASNTGSDFPQRQPGVSSTISNLPQSSSVSTPRDTDGHETGSSENQLQDHSDKSSVHPGHDSCTGISGLSGCDSDLPEPVLLFIMENEVVDEVHRCAICMETFRDISKLHEHYVDHATGV